jgi:hypothetical protein
MLRDVVHEKLHLPAALADETLRQRSHNFLLTGSDVTDWKKEES